MISLGSTIFDAHIGSRVRKALKRLEAHLAFVDRVASVSPHKRRAIAVTGSLLLHVGLLIMLIPIKAGLDPSIGATTGLGEINGIGTAVTLVDVSEMLPPQHTQAEAGPQPAERAQQPSPISETSEVDDDTAEPIETKEIVSEVGAAKAMAVAPDGSLMSDNTTQATADAFGDGGQSNIDLWNAIAPCWSRIADSATLPATLKITFDASGGLAVPPEIERDPNALITDQSLRAEAQALQALSECGNYPIAQGQQGVVVHFPPAGQVGVGTPGSEGTIAAVLR